MIANVNLLFYSIYDAVEHSRTLVSKLLLSQDLHKNHYVTNIQEKLTTFENSLRGYSPYTIIIATLLILYLIKIVLTRICKFWNTISI